MLMVLLIYLLQVIKMHKIYALFDNDGNNHGFKLQILTKNPVYETTKAIVVELYPKLDENNNQILNENGQPMWGKIEKEISIQNYTGHDDLVALTAAPEGGIEITQDFFKALTQDKKLIHVGNEIQVVDK